MTAPRKGKPVALASTDQTSRHKGHYDAPEIAALVTVCCFLDRDIGDLSRDIADDYLKLAYTIPHRERCSSQSFSRRLDLLLREVWTLARAEFAKFDDRAGIEADAKKLRTLLDMLEHILDELCAPLKRGRA